MRTQPRIVCALCRVVTSSALVAILFLIGCNSGYKTPTPYTVGGTVSGLAGSNLVLQDNGGNNLPVSANGPFTFTTALANGAAYAVTVLSQPTNVSQTCTVTAGSGTVASMNVTNVSISCTTSTFTVGGTVSNLAGSNLVLQDNGGDNFTVSGSGSVPFTFPTKLASGAAYGVTVLSQPTNVSQTCTVTSGSGTVTTGNVTSVSVSCVTDTFTVGGTVSGLATSLVLQDNGANNLTVSANGPFVFTTALASGTGYNVTVSTQPSSPTQTCTVTTGGGTVTTGAITTVAVVCTPTSSVLVSDGVNRVLIYDAPITTGQNAAVVLGQPDFTSSNANATPTINTLNFPIGVAADTSGNVFVAEFSNCRVTQFQPQPQFSNGMNASLVIGQPNFTTPCPVSPVASPTSLGGPFGVTLDHGGDLWVTDFVNSRVLEYVPLPTFSNGMAASLAIGQPDLVSGNANQGGAAPTGATLSSPVNAVFDHSGNLWVVDSANNRVLKFTPSPSFSTGMAASVVIGQPNFTSAAPNQSAAAPAANTLSQPLGAAFDSSGDLWIADANNNRVLEFVPQQPGSVFTNGMIANLVLGQLDSVSSGSGSTASTMNFPIAVAFDAKGNLFVTDQSNSRTLVFAPPFSKGMNATFVLGSPQGVTAAGETNPWGVNTAPPPY